jgi:hypothetical protein
MQEQWKTIEGFEDYKISNYGKVKSYRKGKEVILKGSISVKGYKQFQVNGRTYGGHVLVAMAFLGHKPNKMNIVVDHIDNNRQNNDFSNLQLITQRSNSHRLQERYLSKFKGVCVAGKKWRSRIYINGKQKFLGSFNCEFRAHLEYLKAVKCL